MDGWSSVLRPRQHSIGYMGDSFYTTILQHYKKNSYVQAYRLILNNTTKLLILPFTLMLNVDFFGTVSA